MVFVLKRNELDNSSLYNQNKQTKMKKNPEFSRKFKFDKINFVF